MLTTSTPRAEQAAADRDGWIVLFFLCCQTLAQLLLLTPLADTIRVPLRAVPFVTSLVLCLTVARKGRAHRHPAIYALGVSLLVVVLNLFHPQRNTFAASVAQIAMYLAIASPLLWVGNLVVTERSLRWIIMFFWGFSVLSALAGVGQTLRPDWEWLRPNLSLVVQNFNDGGEGLKISLANGARVFRPMGLSDQPGGAAMAGLMCVVFGLGIMLLTRNPWLKGCILISWGLAIYCILLSQVRSVLIMTGICVTAFAVAMTVRGQFGRITWLILMFTGSVIAAGVVAVAVGGETVTSRLTTLIAEDPTTVYMTNRGLFMEFTLKYAIWDYPFGAGLARWGMMNHYFGDPSDPNSETLWVEIMWTGWTYDGGIPLIISYCIAIMIATWQSWKIGTDTRNGPLGLWGAVVFAYNVGCLAVTFNCPLFAGQSGLEFWLINASLFGASKWQAFRHAPLATATPRMFETPKSILEMQP